MSTALVVLPTYNERENIEPLVSMLLALPVDLGVVIVDDNSPDGTGDAADALARAHPGLVHVVHRPSKMGLGTAYLAGFDLALRQPETEYILTMDADFSHHPHYIPKMIDLSTGSYGLVIGSRYVPGGGAPDFPLHRKLLSSGANAFTEILLKLEAHDATSGFRCYKRTLLSTLPLRQIFSSGYSFLIEILYLTRREGFQIGEIPIVFNDRKHGKSKISPTEIWKAAATVARLATRRLPFTSGNR